MDVDAQESLDLLTEEFLGRRRRGEALDVETFAAEHAAHADRIRALFPVLLQIEGVRPTDPVRPRDRVGRWRIVRELGRGGMGVVYLAEDDATGERAAVKLMSADHPEAVARFRREAAAVSRLSHPSICRVLEVAPEGGPLWIAFEYVEGETLSQALHRERAARERSSGQRPARAPDRWLAVGEAVARALHAAHEVGLVHRDVKPSNLLLAADRPVVLDFGLAHADAKADETRLTLTGVPVGTPAYMSPEQVRATGAPLDRRTDVYSLGATLYEALTLEPPFPGPTIAALFGQILTSDPEPLRRRDPALSPDLEVVLATAMEKQPARRYATARHFADDLARARRGDRVRARAPGPLRRLGVWAGRHPRLATAVGVLGTALVTGLVVALTLLSQVVQARDRAAASALRTRARALASASAEVLSSDAALSLLLAREAARAERTPETLTQLHAAVSASLERARLEGHGAPPTSIAWDGSGRTVATGSQDGRARLFGVDGALRRVIEVARAEAAAELEVALSPSGALLATREADGAARLWAADGSPLGPLGDPADPAVRVLFLDDDTAAVLGREGRVSLHRPDASRKVAWTVPLDGAGEGNAVLAAEVADRPPRLHVLTRDLRAIAYDAEGREVGRREQAVGARMASLFEGGRLAFVAAQAKDEARGGRPAPPETLTGIASDGRDIGSVAGSFDPDTLFCGGDDWWGVWTVAGGPVLVDARGRARPLEMQRGEVPGAFRASPDGTRLFTSRTFPRLSERDAFATDAMRLWNPPVGAPLAAVTGTEGVLASATFSPDGRLFALGRHSGGVVVLHATTPEELSTVVPRWRSSLGSRYPPLLTADGRHLAALVDERTLRVLRDDGTVRAEFPVVDAGKATTWVDLHPARGLVLIASGEGGASAYDLDGRRVVRVPGTPPVQRAAWIGGEGRFLTVAGMRVRFHAPDGAIVEEVVGGVLGTDPDQGFVDEIAVARPTGAVEVRGPEGKVRRTLRLDQEGGGGAYHGSPAGPAVWTVTPPDFAGVGLGTSRYLDAQGHLRWETPVGGAGARIARVSRDGERVAVVVSGGLSLRDGKGQEVAALRLGGGISSFSFDGAGTLFAASSMDGTVRIWDREGRLRFDLPNQGGPCFVGLSADGRRIATVTSGMARLFTSDADELDALAARRSTRGFTETERARFADLLGGP